MGSLKFSVKLSDLSLKGSCYLYGIVGFVYFFLSKLSWINMV